MAQEQLDTAQLLAIHKEGNSDDRAALEHLASCAECQQSFDDSRWLMVLRSLRGIVEAGPHPSSDELAAYRGQALSSPRIARIERHLRSCDRCLAAYRRERVVDRKLAYSSPPPKLLKRVQQRFRPRPLRQLGTVLVRQLGEQLGLLFMPEPTIQAEQQRFLRRSTDDPDERTCEDRSPVDGKIMDYMLEDASAAEANLVEHPGSALRRKHRLERLTKSASELPVPGAAKERTVESPMLAGGGFDRGIDLPRTVRIPADEWVLELALMKGHLLLRLISGKKDASANDIRVRVAKKGKDPSEAVTDQDGRILLPLESGRSQITIHADPPFALSLNFPAES